jgi:hypothetical protein
MSKASKSFLVKSKVRGQLTPDEIASMIFVQLARRSTNLLTFSPRTCFQEDCELVSGRRRCVAEDAQLWRIHPELQEAQNPGPRAGCVGADRPARCDFIDFIDLFLFMCCITLMRLLTL